MGLAQDEDDDTTDDQVDEPKDDAGGDDAPATPEDDEGDRGDGKDDAGDQEAGDAEPAPADVAKTKDQQLKDYIEGKYNKAADDSAVKDALARSQRVNNIANIGNALETMARARSQALGGPGADSAFYQGLSHQGAQGIDRAQAARQAQIHDFVTKNQLQRQVTGDELAAKRAAALDVWRRGQTERLQERDSKLDDFRSKKLTQQKSHDAAMVDATGNKAEAKAAAGQKKSYIEMNDKVNGVGRAPPDIKQALKDKQSIDKANELISGRDLNSLSKSEAALLAGELEKIATGGAGTEAGRQGLDPHTFGEQWAAFKNKFVGKDGEVEPAQIGAFIRQQQDYLHGLKKVTDSHLHTYQRGVHDTYLDNGDISDEQSQKFQKRHPELFQDSQQASAAPAAAPAGNKQAAAPPAMPTLDAIDAEIARRKAAAGATAGAK